jgi:hypothetical protein
VFFGKISVALLWYGLTVFVVFAAGMVVLTQRAELGESAGAEF